ncbi:MAG: hypothetical protein ACJAYU_003342 [Bradymonadia bacterium]|jgi:hypothetical protein
MMGKSARTFVSMIAHCRALAARSLRTRAETLFAFVFRMRTDFVARAGASPIAEA